MNSVFGREFVRVIVKKSRELEGDTGYVIFARGESMEDRDRITAYYIHAEDYHPQHDIQAGWVLGWFDEKGSLKIKSEIAGWDTFEKRFVVKVVNTLPPVFAPRPAQVSRIGLYTG